jgi:predicted methyltransferase
MSARVTDRARDASNSLDVLSFFGVSAGMSILDMNAATGWYTEILARLVGPAGHARVATITRAACSTPISSATPIASYCGSEGRSRASEGRP